MKVLFLHPNTPDYLVSGLFHGLRTLLGKNCVDLPRFDCMYKPFTEGMRNKIRGRGFTLYGLLDDIQELSEERFFIWEKNIKDFDLYVVADIWRQWDEYNRLFQKVNPEKIVVVDPADTGRVFPWNNLIKEHRYFRRSLGFLYRRPCLYFKREIYGHQQALSALPGIASLFSRLLLPAQLIPITFSIPEEKIIPQINGKRLQVFAKNIVDPEVSKNINGSFCTPLGKQQYQFSSEEEYYADLQRSKFGITTKRSGWDCLRHYEIAANGAVMCFKNLQDKPPGSAPHQLDLETCISYLNHKDLMKQINELSEDNYRKMQAKSLNWVHNFSTKAVGQRFLDTVVQDY